MIISDISLWHRKVPLHCREHRKCGSIPPCPCRRPQRHAERQTIEGLESSSSGEEGGGGHKKKAKGGKGGKGKGGKGGGKGGKGGKGSEPNPNYWIYSGSKGKNVKKGKSGAIINDASKYRVF